MDGFVNELGLWRHQDGTEISFFRPTGDDWTVDEYWVMWKLPSGEKFRYTIAENRVDAEKLCRDIQRAYTRAPVKGEQFANKLANRTWVEYLDEDAPDNQQRASSVSA